MSSSQGRRPWNAEEAVVVVVPRLAERDPGEPPDVARLVLDAEAARAEEVADGVDRPGDVVAGRSGSGRPRTSPAGRRRGVPPQTQPARKGSSSESPTQSPNQRETKTMPRSASRSFAYFVHSARPTLRKSQPTCACQRPASLPRTPGRSRRGASADRPRGRRSGGLWSETQRITGPCTAIEPSTASP